MRPWFAQNLVAEPKDRIAGDTDVQVGKNVRNGFVRRVPLAQLSNPHFQG
jgi:hypothetical protein